MRAPPWIRGVGALALLLALPWLVRQGVGPLDGLLAGGALDWLRAPLDEILRAFQLTLATSNGVTLSIALFAVPLGAIARMIARARRRAGMGDLLAGARRWAAARRGAMAALLGLPTVTLVAFSFWRLGDATELASGILLACLVGGLAQARLGRAGIDALLREEADGSAERAREGITYDAVARTREASAAIAVVALLSLAMLVVVAVVPLSHLVRDPRLLGLVGAYVASMLGAAALFRHASRAAIGMDGVRVYGTSRERYVAYRDIDEVRTRGVDVELLRKGRVVLALQLHGADATRRWEVIALVEAAIARAAAESEAPSSRLVAASSEDDLVRVIEGASDYRSAALSREQLWAVAEGPGIDANARKAAFAALARSSDAAERARLRVAVAQCAAPSVRVAVDASDDEGDAAPEPPARRAATVR